MISKEQALNTFWNSFELPAYDENTVPDDVEMPYITYSVGTASLGETISLYASIWYYSTRWEDISRKAIEIGKYIGIGGTSQFYTGGRIWIKRGIPFSQRMSEPGNDAVRRIYLNIEVEFQSAD